MTCRHPRETGDPWVFMFISPQDQNKKLRCLLALNRIPYVGFAKLQKEAKKVENRVDKTIDTIDFTIDPEIFFDARDACTFSSEPVDWAGVEKDLSWAAQSHCYLLPFWDPEYPPLLKEIPSPPLVLFVQGDVKRLSRPQLAMVGSRNPTPWGKEHAFTFAQQFAALGFTITSGLAIGIDTEVHRGALQAQSLMPHASLIESTAPIALPIGTAAPTGGTIAVLGNGLDTLYPARNAELAQKILSNGALVSEMPIGTPPDRRHFPRRNRIISGLSLGTFVVEAALKSGSLITAKYAAEQGREVFAMPGSIHSHLARGCHALIRQGAKLVESMEDVLEELGTLLQVITPSKKSKNNKNQKLGLDSDCRALLGKMGFEATPFETLIQRTQLTSTKVSIMLLELEMQGLVATVPGGYIKLKT